MAASILRATTGRDDVDAIIVSIIRAYERSLTGLARGYYVTGSWADGTAVGLSDIDLTILFEVRPPDQETRDRANAVWSSLSSPIHLDVVMRGMDVLPARPSEVVSLKSASLLVYGEDMRDRILWPPPEAYLRDVTARAYAFVGRVLRGTEEPAPPLDYPDPLGEFYGYDRKRVPWYPEGVERGLKEIVTAATRIATALVGLRTGHFVGSKEQSVRVYRQSIGDAYADFLELLYRKAKLEWGYRLPSDPGDRELLHDLAPDMLGFERAFLTEYRQSALWRT